MNEPVILYKGEKACIHTTRRFANFWVEKGYSLTPQTLQTLDLELPDPKPSTPRRRAK